MKKEYQFNVDEFFVRTIVLEDTDTLVKWRSDKELIKFFYNSTPLTKEKHLNWYNNIYLHDNTQLHFLILHIDKPIGFLTLTRISKDNQSCEIGYAICEREYLRMGVANAAIKQLMLFAAKEFDIKVFYAGVHQDNTASINFIKKLGFCACANSRNKFIVYKNERK